MSLSSFVLQFGHSNILSFNSNSTLVLHLVQYFASTVGQVSEKIVWDYIEKQGK